MAYTLLHTLHVLALMVWIGGMVFSHFCLRPALDLLEPPQRLTLAHDVLRRFFNIVLWVSLLTVASGVAMVHLRTREMLPMSWLIMSSVGTGMFGIFLHIRFVRFPKLERTVARGDWPSARSAMAGIRRWVAVNLTLGLGVATIALLRSGN